MSQAEQARFLGAKVERTKNLGHDSTVDRLTENPAGRVDDYTNDVGKQIVRGPARSQSVYGRFRDPKDGTSASENLSRWSDYAHAGSYQGGDGTGKEVSARDPRGGTVPSGARTKNSDGYLESTKGWAGYDRGADSGEGRLQKARKY
jgi:hypothetical protein